MIEIGPHLKELIQSVGAGIGLICWMYFLYRMTRD